MNWINRFFFIVLILIGLNSTYSQSRVWIEDSTEYFPPQPSIGWDSLKSLIQYPEIYNRAGIEQSQSIVAFISSQGKIDSVNYRKMYQVFIQWVDSAIYSTTWLPGKFKGIPIDTSITIRIAFKLYDSENAPPINIISPRHVSRGHWEFLPVIIDTNLVQIPSVRPENFNFIFKWDIFPDSGYLDTSEKLFITKKGDVDTSVSFSLSDDELDSIYQKMREIHFLCYPKDFSPGYYGVRDPSFSYYCKIMVEDFENEISLDTGLMSNDPSYKNLKDLFSLIYKIIHKSEDYKKIRKPKYINIYE